VNTKQHISVRDWFSGGGEFFSFCGWSRSSWVDDAVAEKPCLLRWELHCVKTLASWESTHRERFHSFCVFTYINVKKHPV